MEVFDIIAQSEDFKYFAKSGNSIAHSVMLINRDEEYTLDFAKLLAVLILDGRIDKSSQNYQKVMFGSHPDVKYYPAKNQLLVADSEEIVSESFVRPIFSSRKIFIIKNIDNSTESAQNKLLKTLEEPSEDAYLILTCSNPNQVLPTIKSRCIKRELAKVPEEQILALLGESENSALAAVVADGGVGKAQRLANKEGLDELASVAVEVLTKMLSSKQVLEFSKRIQKFPKDFELFIQCLSFAVESLLQIKAGVEPKLAIFKEQLASKADDYTIRALCKINEKICELEREMFYNVNPIFAIENLLLNILEVKYICK